MAHLKKIQTNRWHEEITKTLAFLKPADNDTPGDQTLH